MPRVSFHQLARNELIDAAVYYEQEQVGLGAAFLDAIERATAAISDLPESAPVIRGRVRRKLIRRFP
jgi:toxin ParE1/3/4